MILPLVSELVARIARLQAIQQGCEKLRRKEAEVAFAGFTDSAKAILVPLIFRELGRPIILLVDSNQRAEELLEPLRWFYRAATAKPGVRVVRFPAYDVLPYENRSPHAEISEARAVALWRMASGEADLVIAPIQAALWRMRDRDFYRDLARVIARDDSIAHEDLIGFLNRAGYEKQVTCEMPGQYSVRGGIIDIFSPEAPQPVRVELLGDTIESIRAFDPNTQRSTNPVERAVLLPLTELLRGSEVLAHQAVASASARADESAPPGFYPGWEFREFPLEHRPGVLFDLAAEPLLVMDEPSLLRSAIEEYRARMQAAFEKAESPLAEPPDRYIFNEDEWSLALQLFPQLSIEHLALAGGASETFALQTQPTTRHHGNVPAFMDEVRARLHAGERVLVSAASTGELERFADICHEYDLPYSVGELEENVTVTRLAQESSTTNAPAMVLVKTTFVDAVPVLPP